MITIIKGKKAIQTYRGLSRKVIAPKIQELVVPSLTEGGAITDSSFRAWTDSRTSSFRIFW